MKKYTLEDKMIIYTEFHNGESYQGLAKKYGMNFSNLRYMIKFVDKYGWDEYVKNSHYPLYLKEQLIKRAINNEDTIFNIALEGGLKSRTQLQEWIRNYKNNGYNIVGRKRGRSTMLKSTKKKSNETIEEENKRLKKENEYLKAELEYSKKLRAVVQARKNLQQKKK